MMMLLDFAYTTLFVILIPMMIAIGIALTWNKLRHGTWFAK